MVIWVLGTIYTFLVLLKSALRILLDLLRSRSGWKNHLTTFPPVLAVTADSNQELRDEFLNRTSLTSASLTDDHHGEVVAHHCLHDVLLLDGVFSSNHDILIFYNILELLVKYHLASRVSWMLTVWFIIFVSLRLYFNRHFFVAQDVILINFIVPSVPDGILCLEKYGEQVASGLREQWYVYSFLEVKIVTFKSTL